MPTTLSPRAARRWTTCMPMKPAAPVTRTFIVRLARSLEVDRRHALHEGVAVGSGQALGRDRALRVQRLASAAAAHHGRSGGLEVRRQAVALRARRAARL